MNKVNREWIRRIWEHRGKAKRQERMHIQPLGACLRATVALLLDRWELPSVDTTTQADGFDGWIAVAWGGGGSNPWHSYGTEYYWDALVVRGFRVFEYSDSSL